MVSYITIKQDTNMCLYRWYRYSRIHINKRKSSVARSEYKMQSKYSQKIKTRKESYSAKLSLNAPSSTTSACTDIGG